MDKKQFFERFPETSVIGRDATPDELVVYFDHNGEVGAWRENRRTTTGEGEILGLDDAAAARHRYAHQRAPQPQDLDSGLVERNWVRTSRKRGMMTERTLEGEDVSASFLDRLGQLQHVAGKVTRNDAGELVVESWMDGVRQEIAVTRNASVNVKGR
ncbi:hypothetical protein [Singulisphaera acidiphila]|uniref:Uncharacterized protein n=1 Tax=Singulisphaera acidiphila (strain ATCC BAA-1392 / DSM 18658 / VKM B-2454 / MOB10) TaxID=886293 RepID=L0DRT9_SINAD|nr:hypothetical protein [Singulisphaera acidiphila]AGA31710.1 hypothetical protein Sinac_7682 [Singulisphaera acidiphila DSM 18658]